MPATPTAPTPEIKKRSFPPIHPFLFAFYAVLAAWAREIDSVEPVQAIRPAIVLLLATGLVLLLLYLWIKDLNRAALITSALVVLLLYYKYSYSLPRHIHLGGLSISRAWVILLGWVLVLAFISSKWLWKNLRPHVITGFLNLLSVIYLAIPIYMMVNFYQTVRADPLTGYQPPAGLSAELKSAAPAGDVTKPDIYYIILDGYTRQDILTDMYGYDNQAVVSFLEQRGFYVASQSTSNYVQTAVSLGSSLNLRYLDDFTQYGSISGNRYPMADLVADSQARRFLESQGYEMVALASEYLVTDIKSADTYIAYDNGPFTDFESLLMATSFVEMLSEENLVKWPVLGYNTHRARILYGFEQLASLPPSNKPRFVFAHIVTPHPPFVFDSQGSPIEPDRSYFMGDGSMFRGSDQEYIRQYSDQLTFINQQLEKTVDAILAAHAGSPPVIVIQGDHGSGIYLDFESAENTCVRERSGIFNAYLLPGKEQALYPSISPVNTFRVIFNQYFSANLPLLPDLVYYSPWSRPYLFQDVTARVGDACTQ